MRKPTRPVYSLTASERREAIAELLARGIVRLASKALQQAEIQPATAGNPLDSCEPGALTVSAGEDRRGEQEARA
jgi:hypothetical protein